MANQAKQIRIIRVEWIATMTGPVMRDAAVAVQGDRIVAVGNPRDVIAEFPSAPIRRFEDALLVPGLVNCHTHLELTSVVRPTRGGDFVDWLNQTRQAAMAVDVPQSVAAGIAQCMVYGVTCVGDVSLNCQLTREIIGDSLLRGVSFGEVLGLGKRAGQFGERFAAATDPGLEREYLRIGIEPHAPYSTSVEAYEKCVQFARENNVPIATHIAETKDEAEFLSNHTGAFRKLWDALGGWDATVPKYPGSPIELMKDVGMLDLPALLAHANYVGDEELDLLSRFPVSVAYCPRTHKYFGHEPHRFREMIKRGINVAIATDSAASSGDINLLGDARLVHQKYPDFPVEQIWKMITVNAAQALGMHSELGNIEVGKLADFVMFNVASEDPLREVLESERLPAGIWIGGKRM